MLSSFLETIHDGARNFCSTALEWQEESLDESLLKFY
jgi:hypothetical protein